MKGETEPWYAFNNAGNDLTPPGTAFVFDPLTFCGNNFCDKRSSSESCVFWDDTASLAIAAFSTVVNCRSDTAGDSWYSLDLEHGVEPGLGTAEETGEQVEPSLPSSRDFSFNPVSDGMASLSDVVNS